MSRGIRGAGLYGGSTAPLGEPADAGLLGALCDASAAHQRAEMNASARRYREDIETPDEQALAGDLEAGA
jgi:hypothetical protein